MSSQGPELVEYTTKIAYAQLHELKLAGEGKLDDALKLHALVDKLMRPVEKMWKFDAMVLNLAGYHRKNAYTLKHWDAIQAGRPPKDRLLERAERFFFETLFVEPTNYSALHGLGSLPVHQRHPHATDVFSRPVLP